MNTANSNPAARFAETVAYARRIIRNGGRSSPALDR
jgi:hypothetical protein